MCLIMQQNWHGFMVIGSANTGLGAGVRRLLSVNKQQSAYFIISLVLGVLNKLSVTMIYMLPHDLSNAKAKQYKSI
jgi:predicted membrane-bound spermidine synthase